MQRRNQYHCQNDYNYEEILARNVEQYQSSFHLDIKCILD